MQDRCVHAIVHGRVQGVCFRDYTRNQAEALGLRGWVRNLPDGTVETVFAGTEAQVKALLAWLSVGSPHARVDLVEHRDVDPLPDHAGFHIRY